VSSKTAEMPSSSFSRGTLPSAVLSASRATGKIRLERPSAIVQDGPHGISGGVRRALARCPPLREPPSNVALPPLAPRRTSMRARRHSCKRASDKDWGGGLSHQSGALAGAAQEAAR